MPNPDEKDIVDETAAVSLEPTMWAELSPDMYDGPTCDRVRHRWWVRCQGEEGEYQHDDLVLDPKAFPPGTKITIQEPLPARRSLSRRYERCRVINSRAENSRQVVNAMRGES